MAGAFTHMVIVAEAIKSFSVEQNFGKILRENKNFLTLGSVGPDIPYLAHLAFGGFDWANIMHYHNTNRIVNNSLHSLAVSKARGKIWKNELAWLLGFVSHLVADATIHPIVECIVGPYTDESNIQNHRECEMIQDVMILHEITNNDVTYAEYTNFLRTSFEHPSFKQVAYFWAIHAEANCPFIGSFSTERIIDSYIKELDTAEGGNALSRAFRHFNINFVYKTYDEVVKKYPDLVEKYYTNIQLPNGKIGSFRTDGFDYAVRNLSNVWSKIERSIFSKENISQIIPNWNLDTGIDQEKEIRTYWS
jgi:hypothetical protein